jgi:hypothetical protein
MNANLFWIPGPWRGRLAIAARPRGGDWLEEEARAWRCARVDVVVSLLENDEAAELELSGEGNAADSNGTQFVSFPITDRGVPASRRDALSLIGSVTAMLEQGKNVAVHCRQGVGRSQQAMNAVSAARGQTIPEPASQLEWIKRLPSQLGVEVANRGLEVPR